MKAGNRTHERIGEVSIRKADDVFAYLGTPPEGHNHKSAERSRGTYGSNELSGVRKDGIAHILKRAFLNPFSVVLITLALITLLTDRFLEKNLNGSPATVPIMLLMVLVSGCIRIYQDMKGRKVTRKLLNLVDVRISVLRDGEYIELSPDEIVVGDRLLLNVGDRVPADMRLLSPSSCFVSEAMLTGESGGRMKVSHPLERVPENLKDLDNILFQGSVITSGNAEGVVVAVGRDTAYGEIEYEEDLSGNGFDKGANSIAWVLIRFMAILVPVVFIASGITQDNWISAFLFALSVAVGLTPEMLPMVISACLAKGSRTLGSKETVVKDINAMQGFGSMDTLCVDKTGTLTEDRLVLEYWLDVIGNESSLTLDLAYISVLDVKREPDNIERSILDISSMPGRKRRIEKIEGSCRIISSLPFDYERRISSVIAEMDGKRFVIAKGEPENILRYSDRILWKDEILPMEGDKVESVQAVTEDMTEDGLKVLAVAVREIIGKTGTPESEERNLALVGYIAFFDAPKKSAAPALKALDELYVDVKLLTGDNLQTARSTARRLGMDTLELLRGIDIENMEEDDLRLRIERTSIFAELTPRDKARIVRILRENGHTVGFLGDGMNDLSAILSSNVGISVDNASEALKDSADVVLMRKDLSVVAEGIRTGRKAFVNMTKYIKITASSNLGNIIAIIVASVFLPFFPMTSVQLLLLNLLYDILCLAIPWDNVDERQCEKPLEWSGRSLSGFMVFFGPISSIFDMVTFGFLMFFLCPHLMGGRFSLLSPEGQEMFISLFQTGWFLESMWTQVMILHLLRTERMPYIKSRPSIPVTLVTLLGTALFTWIVMTDAGSLLGMARLPIGYFAFLAAVVVLYLVTVTGAKRIFLKKHGRLI